MYTLVFSKVIRDDINSCYNYIKDTLEAPEAANKMIEELMEKIAYLKDTPKRRPLVQDKYLASLGIRSIKVKNYVIYYNVDDTNNKVNIFRYLYSKRDWMNILKEKPIEEIM